jgi:hypothetical protein
MRVVASILGLWVGWMPGAQALVLGDPAVESYLGQALHVRVPVSGLSSLRDPEAECVRLLDPDDMDDVPGLRHGHLQWLASDNGMMLDITRAAPVQEPLLRLTIETGCKDTVVRSFTVLLDPAPLTAAAHQVTAVTPVRSSPVLRTVESQHSLGQTLRLRLPIAATEKFDPANASPPAVLVSSVDGDVLTLSLTREWISDAQGKALLVQSAEDVNEPALSLHLRFAGQPELRLPVTLDPVGTHPVTAPAAPATVAAKAPLAKTAAPAPATRVARTPVTREPAATPQIDPLAGKQRDLQIQQLQEKILAMDAEMTRMRQQLAMTSSKVTSTTVSSVAPNAALNLGSPPPTLPAAQGPASPSLSATVAKPSKHSRSWVWVLLALATGVTALMVYREWQKRHVPATTWDDDRMGDDTDPVTLSGLPEDFASTQVPNTMLRKPSARHESLAPAGVPPGPHPVTLETLTIGAGFDGLTDLLRPIEVTELNEKGALRQLLTPSVLQADDRFVETKAIIAGPDSTLATVLNVATVLADKQVAAPEPALSLSDAGLMLNLDLDIPSSAPTTTRLLLGGTAGFGAFEQVGRISPPDHPENGS